MRSNKSVINIYKIKNTKSEVVTQLLYGDTFKKLKKIGSWIKIKKDTDNYKGYRYLAIDEVPTGCVPGIRRDRGEEKQFDNTDRTRVRYF